MKAPLKMGSISLFLFLLLICKLFWMNLGLLML